MSRKKSPLLRIQDRKLGDEWLDWRGTLEDYEKNATAGKRIFLSLLLGLIVFFGMLGYTIWYMITPRLVQFHPRFPLYVGLLFLVVWGILSLWFLIMVLSILLEKDLFLHLGGKRLSITFLVPIVLRFGIRLGFSRDRMGNSFVKISNTLIRGSTYRVKPEKLLILLPRCLQKSLMNRIVDFAKQSHIPVFTVAGGEKAREIVYKMNPQAIIGVACERDLLSGIQEIVSRIPVIGIPNRRPEGPCKNTTIDFQEFMNAIQTFLGPELRTAG